MDDEPTEGGVLTELATCSIHGALDDRANSREMDVRSRQPGKNENERDAIYYLWRVFIGV